MAACLCLVIGGLAVGLNLCELQKYTLTGGKTGIFSVLTDWVKGFQVKENLSVEEIEVLREQYPIYGIKLPELLCMASYSFEDAVEMSDTLIYAEITGDYQNYTENVAEWREYPVTVIEDTDGVFDGGEQIFINHTEILKDYYGTLTKGMKIIVPVHKEDGAESRYNYSVIGMYYVTEDGYVISAYDEEKLAERIYSGMKVEQFLEAVP